MGLQAPHRKKERSLQPIPGGRSGTEPENGFRKQEQALAQNHAKTGKAQGLLEVPRLLGKLNHQWTQIEQPFMPRGQEGPAAC
jgi:hypothetical protein